MIETILIRASWQTVRDTGVWQYQINTRTGARRARRVGPGHQPLSKVWLDGGEFQRPPKMRDTSVTRR